jgi:hypothetical protein
MLKLTEPNEARSPIYIRASCIEAIHVGVLNLSALETCTMIWTVGGERYYVNETPEEILAMMNPISAQAHPPVCQFGQHYQYPAMPSFGQIDR